MERKEISRMGIDGSILSPAITDEVRKLQEGLNRKGHFVSIDSDDRVGETVLAVGRDQVVGMAAIKSYFSENTNQDG